MCVLLSNIEMKTKRYHIGSVHFYYLLYDKGSSQNIVLPYKIHGK